MRHLKQLCAACALTAVLALTTSAGQMTTGVVDPPPPPPSATTQGDVSTTVAGEMTTGVADTATATEIALNLLQSLLALL